MSALNRKCMGEIRKFRHFRLCHNIRQGNFFLPNQNFDTFPRQGFPQ